MQVSWLQEILPLQLPGSTVHVVLVSGANAKQSKKKWKSDIGGISHFAVALLQQVPQILLVELLVDTVIAPVIDCFLIYNSCVHAANASKLPPQDATTATCRWCWATLIVGFLFEQMWKSQRNKSDRGGGAQWEWHCCNKCHKWLVVALIDANIALVDCF